MAPLYKLLLMAQPLKHPQSESVKYTSRCKPLISWELYRSAVL